MNKQDFNEQVEKHVNHVLSFWERLDAEKFPREMTRSNIIALFKTAVSARTGTWLRKPRKDASPQTRVFFERLDWHRGRRTSLWGPMMSMHLVGKAEWDEIDTLATIIGHLCGSKSASEVWARALGRTV